MDHFENLWDESEQHSSKEYENLSTEEIADKIKHILDDYKSINTNNINYSYEVIRSLKKRYMGELLFLLTAISMRDEINVYVALQEEIDIMKD